MGGLTPALEQDRVTVYAGDCLDVLAALDDASVEAVVTDPPYGIGFMGHEWDQPGVELGRREGIPTGQRRRADPAPSGFGAEGAAMEAGRYDLSRTANAAFGEWCRRWLVECHRVLRPGGHVVVFGGARTWHRLAVAVEDAGFEIRDSIAWLFGSGFPKSLDVSKAIDKAAGAEREVVSTRKATGNARKSNLPGHAAGHTNTVVDREFVDTTIEITAPATEDARTWQGWGTALKPAFEPIVVARKPLVGTVAANVLEHGTGAINVDAARVRMTPADRAETEGKNRHADWGSPNGGKDTYGDFTMTPRGSYDGSSGRWPTNLVLSHGEGCTLRGQIRVKNGVAGPNSRGFGDGQVFGRGGELSPRKGVSHSYGDEDAVELVEDWACDPTCPVGLLGVEARFFPTFRYQRKAPSHERPGTTDVDGTRVAHPTVKPLDLMRWLVRLVTPPGGTVLDPFAGSGTTGEACVVEGLGCILVERHPPYVELIRARLTKPIEAVLW